MRSPTVTETSSRIDGREQRAHQPTLSGLGTREQLPTLIDDESPLPPTARPRVHAIIELSAADKEQLLREAERLSVSFDWDRD